MAISQNGWIVISSNDLDRSPIPGTNVVPVPGLKRGDVATVLLHVGKLFNERVAKVYNPGCWGWAQPTPIPGSNVYSNHGSGTALDLNAPSFPWQRRTMSDAQREACRGIVRELGGVVDWGGDWSRVDEMHFEIHASASVQQVAAMAQKIRHGSLVLGATNTQGDQLMTDEFIKNAYYKIEARWPSQGEIDFHKAKSNPASFINGFKTPRWVILQDQVQQLTDRLNGQSGLQSTVAQLQREVENMKQLELKEDIAEAAKEEELMMTRARIEQLEVELEEAKSQHQTVPPVIVESPQQPAKPSASWLTKLLLAVMDWRKKKA